MNIEDIKKELSKDLEGVDLKTLQDVKNKYLGKKGLVGELTKDMASLSVEEKKELGKKVNEIKNYVEEEINNKYNSLNEEVLNKKLESERIDITLPGTSIPSGAPNILEKLVEEMEEVFMSMGYDVVDGPEVEEDRFNFELLNIPKGHQEQC